MERMHVDQIVAVLSVEKLHILSLFHFFFLLYDCIVFQSNGLILFLSAVWPLYACITHSLTSLG